MDFEAVEAVGLAGDGGGARVGADVLGEGFDAAGGGGVGA